MLTPSFDLTKLVMDVRKRAGLLVIAGAVLLLLIAYPSFSCTIPREEIQVSLHRRWAVGRLDGAAVGLTFNVTNRGGCDLHLQEITITVHDATYSDGYVDALDFTETQYVPSTISPNELLEVPFTFDYIFQVSPVKMTMRVEMVFRETGSMIIFDGETQIPSRT